MVHWDSIFYYFQLILFVKIQDNLKTNIMNSMKK